MQLEAVNAAAVREARRSVWRVGEIVPDVMIEEQHNDALEITDHPVEQLTGNTGFISDHAYNRPSEVTITYGWSPNAEKNRASDFLNSMYARILKAQSDRLLLQVRTTRRTYENMLVQAVSLTTDRYTENALICRIVCREVIIARTKEVNVGPLASQENPQGTAATVNRGIVTPKLTTKYSLFGAAPGGL
jgi:hypothetical protein